MTEQELEKIVGDLDMLPGRGKWSIVKDAERAAWITANNWGVIHDDYDTYIGEPTTKTVVDDVRESLARFIADAPETIRKLAHEIEYRDRLLADLCEDSRAVAEVGRLRVVLGEVRGLTDAANDGWRDLLSRHPGAAIRLHTMQDTIDAALEGGGE